jgi:branched-subunit amino acid transport protein AzlD
MATTAYMTPSTALNVFWRCLPFMTFCALPQEPCIIVYVIIREQLTTSLIGKLAHYFYRTLTIHKLKYLLTLVVSQVIKNASGNIENDTSLCLRDAPS